MKGPLMKRKYLLLVVVSAVLAIVGCGGSNAPADTASAPTTPPPAPAAETEKSEPAPAPEKFDVDFVEAKVSTDTAKSLRVSIDVPGFDQMLPTSMIPTTRIRYKVTGMSDAPEGSFLQLVLDNKPFRPITDMNEKIMLTELTGTGTLEDGEHIIAGFVSRPNHESIKTEKGVAVRRFYVGKRSAQQWNSNRGPLLVLASPPATVTGDPLVDFLVLNATLSGSDHSVRALITGPGIKPDGIRRVITDWKPWIILSARAGGEYTVDLQMLDKNGDDVPYGAAVGTFTVKP